MSDFEAVVQALIKSGIDENIARSMAKSTIKATRTAKPGKKRVNPANFTPARAKIDMPVIVTQTCTTCKTVTTFKRVMKVYSDDVPEQTCTVGICINCIKQFDLMTKDQLVSLIVLQNHPDVELRMLSTSRQIKLAKQKTAQEWLLMKVEHTIATNDEGKEF